MSFYPSSYLKNVETSKHLINVLHGRNILKTVDSRMENVIEIENRCRATVNIIMEIISSDYNHEG